MVAVISRGLLIPLLALGGLLTGPVALAADAPERVRDPAYGMVLYEFYQDNAFAALSRLAVAEARGGIEGHGDHPVLLRGGLMLGYGMTREARILFQDFLDESVDPALRNQAWFYLGKVFYLEQDPQAAPTLERVDGAGLAGQAPELYQEWLYLRGQLALARDPAGADDMIAALPGDSLWQAYLRYNRAVARIGEGADDVAASELSALGARLRETVSSGPEPAEARALADQVYLSLGRLQLRQERNAAALEHLGMIALDSLVAEPALLHYAIAAARGGAYTDALQALDELSERPLFTPWLQQVPVARGFVFERLGQDRLALQAYTEASAHYQSQLSQLRRKRARLTEADILQAVGVTDERTRATDFASSGSAWSNPGRDGYGRLQTTPEDPALASVLARESFQLALRDLHELYRLQRTLAHWQRQLESFDVMLDTRVRQRRVRVEQTREALDLRDLEQLRARQRSWHEAFGEARSRDDAAFFMTDSQKSFARKIREVSARLDALSQTDATRRQRQQLERIRAYLDWQVADQYGVNRWAAERQLQGLDRALATLDERAARLQRELASDDRNQALEQRLAEKAQRLQQLDTALKRALGEARETLLQQVREELQRQERGVQQHLLAARQAQARLSDTLLREDIAAPENDQ